MSKDYAKLYYALIFVLLAAGIIFVPTALIAAVPASIALVMAGKVFRRYEIPFHGAFISSFWAVFTYLTVSMLMSLLLYWRAVYIQDYKMSFHPSWLINYYTPRHVPAYYKIMSVLHIVSMLAAALVFSRKLKSRQQLRIPFGYAFPWTLFVLLPCLLFGMYSFIYVVHHLFPEATQAAIDYTLIK